ncbi:hypothetical protein SAMN05720766_10831 [Fibrobacter sp. UWH9]|nr:hypothetical protein [Fibrobacter succinogenes]SHH16870.1 hypothetical protein SAMN05720766_10831 [Fibrobacter sp. UWH9]
MALAIIVINCILSIKKRLKFPLYLFPKRLCRLLCISSIFINNAISK